MKAILRVILFPVAAVVSCAAQADSAWYTLWNQCEEPETGAGPAHDITSSKHHGELISVKDVTEGGKVVEVTVTTTHQNPGKTYYRTKERCKKGLAKQQAEYARKEREQQQLRDRYK